MSRRILRRRHTDRWNGYASLALKVALTGAILMGYGLSVYSARVCYDNGTICTASETALMGVKDRCRHFDEVMAGMETFMTNREPWQ